jgi:hypothetical protein
MRARMYAAGLLALVHGAAVAQPVPGVPGLALLDRQDGVSSAGASLTLAPISDPTFIGDGLVFRLDLSAEYAFGASGFSAYGVVPLALLQGDMVDATAVGNLEGGALYALHGGARELLVRLGLSLPTASSSDSDGAFANILGAYARPTDFALAWPRTMWLRASASPVVRSGLAILRADAGLDLAVAALDEELDSPDPLLRVNLAGGVDSGRFAALAELSAITGIGSDDDVGIYEQDIAYAAALSGHLRGAAVEPSLAVGLPLNSDVRDLLSLFVVAGLQGRLP